MPYQLLPEEITSEELSLLADNTNLPALARSLRILAQQKSDQKWVNQYCDYSDCALLW